MSTPFGVITHEWTIVPDNSIFRNDLEIEGMTESIVKKQLVVEPEPEIKVKPVVAPKPVKKIR
jgi:hypothetical protein